MKMNDRIVAMSNANVNMGKYFSLLVNESIPAGSVINISVDTENAAVATSSTNVTTNETAKKIVEDGYVKNSKIHRRWITAQYMRMLNYDNKYNGHHGWNAYLSDFYSYRYQFDMMLEEVRVLSKLERKDMATYRERSQFFTLSNIRLIISDYLRDLEEYLIGEMTKHGKVWVNGFGYLNTVEDIRVKVIGRLRVFAEACRYWGGYKDMYIHLKTFVDEMIVLPHDAKKIKRWVCIFQLEGAYYTLRNLIMFHNVKLYYMGEFLTREESLDCIRRLAQAYEGYQMNALLKKTIELNHFDFKTSVQMSVRDRS